MNTEDIKNVVVIGSGIMGAGIVQNFAQAGINVKVSARRQESLDNCMILIKANINQFNTHGLIDEKPSAIIGRIETVLAENLDDAIKDCDFAMETIPENKEAKQELLVKLDSLPDNVVIGSNTSSFTINDLTTGMKTPERVVGIHYFNPAHIIPAVEIHSGDKTNPEAIGLARDLMKKVGKKPAIVKKAMPGFIINRLTGALYKEASYLIDQGVTTPEEMDEAVKGSFGFRLACLGPMETEDMIGLDTSAFVSDRVFGNLSPLTGASDTLKAKVEKGETGIKAGKGWYDYSGKSEVEVKDEINQRLLIQLAVFNKQNKK
ncbi:MAG: 3-hydroxyacyl-CoA dehydrogenase family protein [Deltaproteobacteria bacterium]|jgi:3-hydroxyacyl-CoA dehydrogenase|nr:3-hydroxyacyl-CoA dehydrogenase family protein [Deltaproteobacteria bacterium]